MTKQALIGIIMGSRSDINIMQAAKDICIQFDVPCEMRICSAHRTPLDMTEYAQQAHSKGLKVLIAGAGGAAHLPGMVASLTPIPVIGVPISNSKLDGIDALLSIAQMPGGVPVATMAIDGAMNAGLMAIQIIAQTDAKLLKKIVEYREKIAAESRAQNTGLDDTGLDI